MHARDEKMIRNFMEKPGGRSLLGDLRGDGRTQHITIKLKRNMV
jgi:hypothetical protein